MKFLFRAPFLYLGVLSACTQPVTEPEPEDKPKGLYTENPDMNETIQGMLNVALANRNPDCRTYVTDANDLSLIHI